MNTTSKQFPPRTTLTGKLAEKEYRAAFVETEIRRGLPFQIKAIRESRGWNQERLGIEAGIPQGNISRIENTRDTFLSFPTLLKIAAAYDVALVVKFASFSELEEFAKRPVEDMIPADYLSDTAEREAREAAEATRSHAADASEATVTALDTFLRNALNSGTQSTAGDGAEYMRRGPQKSKESQHGISRDSKGSRPLLHAFGVDEPSAQSR